MENLRGASGGRKARIISLFVTLALLIAVVLCVYVMLQSLSSGYVSIGGVSVFRVVTGSMEPEIPVGALLVSRREDIDRIQERDVICFRSREAGMQGMIITHRVIGVYTGPDGQPFLQTKGDANLSVDGYPVTSANLVGRVIWHTGDGSTMAAILSFLTSKFGFLACILLPVLLVAIWIFRDVTNTIRKQIKEVEKQLREQDAEDNAVSVSEEEYAQIYERVAQEVRKELEQNAAHSDVAEELSDDGARPVEQDDGPAPTGGGMVSGDTDAASTDT